MKICVLLVKSAISIHALREEGDRTGAGQPAAGQPFLSTPSARRATRMSATSPTTSRNFYPRPPRGGRPRRPGRFPARPRNFYPRPPRGGRHPITKSLKEEFKISIHALREEGDDGEPFKQYVMLEFLSTPSARRATAGFRAGALDSNISIHALREEGDETRTAALQDGDQFLSTPSARRATCQRPKILGRAYKFLSTPSARRAT